MSDMRKNLPRSGFTLLELLVVVGILAALVALALPYYQDYVNQAKMTAADADLQSFKKALTMFDQLEPNMYTANDFLPLIGKYLQDFRKFSGQANPVDPWSNDYVIRPAAGTILSYGPDRTLDTTVLTDRIPVDDDIMVTWKPEFYVTGGRTLNARTIELTFSRRVETIAFGNVSEGTAGAAASMQKISDTVFRFAWNANLPAGNKDITVANNVVKSQDGKFMLTADKKPNGDDATEMLFP